MKVHHSLLKAGDGIIITVPGHVQTKKVYIFEGPFRNEDCDFSARNYWGSDVFFKVCDKRTFAFNAPTYVIPYSSIVDVPFS